MRVAPEFRPALAVAGLAAWGIAWACLKSRNGASGPSAAFPSPPGTELPCSRLLAAVLIVGGGALLAVAATGGL